jgi:hypothetical protein
MGYGSVDQTVSKSADFTAAAFIFYLEKLFRFMHEDTQLCRSSGRGAGRPMIEKP